MNSTTTLAPSRPSATEAATRFSALDISFSNSSRLGRPVSGSRNARWRRRSLALRSRAFRPDVRARSCDSSLPTSSEAPTSATPQATSSPPRLRPDSPSSLRHSDPPAKRAAAMPA